MASAAATTNWIVDIVYTQCNFFATLLSYILYVHPVQFFASYPFLR